jgi:hypothetical protein
VSRRESAIGGPEAQRHDVVYAIHHTGALPRSGVILDEPRPALRAAALLRRVAG